MATDHFPSAHATWIDAQLTIAERGRSAGDAAVESNAIDAAGRLDEYEVFRRHVLDGLEYSVIGADMGLTRQQCANCVRRVSDRVREALRDVLRAEGVPGSELEAELSRIRRLLGDEG